MADSRKMEYDNLQAVIASIENAMPNASQSARPILQTALANARKQLENIEKEIKKEEQQERAVQDAQIVAAAERETALSRSEKETYNGFLKEDFFTKKDFGRLEGFYAHTWDKLSEHGKEEMSHRVWEGVRHGEYKFSELPKDVREKETGRVYKVLTQRIPGTDLDRIPESERNEFVRAVESDNRDEAEKILGRPSFKENVAVGTSRNIDSENADKRRQQQKQDVNAQVIGATAKPMAQNPPDDKSSKAQKDLSSLDLSKITLAEPAQDGPGAGVPKTNSVSQRG